jgi:hypothetical protein
MSRPTEIPLEPLARASLSDERLRIADLSPGEINQSGLGQHAKPMTVEIGFVREQLATLDGGEELPHHVNGAQTAPVKHLSADPGETLAGGAPRVCIHGPPHGWPDQGRITDDGPVLLNNSPSEFCGIPVAAETGCLKINEGDPSGCML